MAITKGQGNPNWTREETILALDLYLSVRPKSIGEEHAKVKALSKLLQSLPIHPIEKRGKQFRNPASISFKLSNIKSVDSGGGFENASKIDKLVFSELGNKPNEVKTLAKQIVAAANTLYTTNPEVDDVFAIEGTLVFRAHKIRERSNKFRNRKIESARAAGTLSCEGCGRGPDKRVGSAGEAIFELHHKVPLSIVGKSKTRLSDLSILCANCHRIIHAMGRHDPNRAKVSDLRALIADANR